MPDLSPQQTFDLAFSHHSAGRLPEAQSLYQLLLNQTPNHPDLLHLSGLVAHQQNDHPRALDLISRAIASNPNDPAYHSNLAEVHRALHQPELALAALDRALQLKPNYPAALTNRANILLQLHRLPEAEAAARLALTLQPNLPQAHHNLGTILQAQNLLPEAQRAYEQALTLDPTLPDAWNNLATLYEKQNQFPLAKQAYEKALSLNPNFAAAHNHLGLLLHRLGNTPTAITSFDHALHADPHYIDAHWNLSLALLLTGNLPRGWDEYEYRWQYPLFPSSPRHFKTPLWTGQNLAGKTLLLHAEQGFGDAIQFARYAPLLAAQGNKIFLEARPQLTRLFHSLKNVTILTYEHPADAESAQRADADLESSINPDYHCPLLSLPRAFKTTLENIPNQVPYLSPEPQLVTHFQKLLARASVLSPGTRPPLVGLCFANSAAQRTPPSSSSDAPSPMPDTPVLSDFASLFHLPNLHFISLQIGPAQSQIAPSGLPLLDLSAHIQNFAHTAALISNLDLIITVDTAVAHLAGALAKPTFLLLPHLPDWRWLLNRNDSPWYPTLKLFRAPAPNTWPEVIAQLATALQSLLSSNAQRPTLDENAQR